MRNVRISPDGLLIKRGTILPASFAFPFLLKEWKTRSLIRTVGRNYFRRQSRIEPEAFWITDTWSPVYFHWLCDVLSKLFVVRNLIKTGVLLLPHTCEKYDFVQSSLRAFEVEHFQFIAADEVARCGRLLLPAPIAPSGHFREEIIRGVRQQLLTHFNAPAVSTKRRIYISRARANKRRIVNEPEVCAVLERFGFEVIHAEDLSFAAQVGVFSESNLLVSNHGAGLTNMLFLKSGGQVLELRHQTDRISNCYFTMASALSLNYFYQLCSPQNQDEDPHLADLFVDTDALDRNLTLMLNS